MMERYGFISIIAAALAASGCYGDDGGKQAVAGTVVYPDAWKKGVLAVDESFVKGKLTPLQFAVTRREDTEPPFNNEYWHNERPGLYVDVISGAPLFSSTDKFDSGTGWPSFTKPLSPDAVEEKPDNALGMARVEVRSRLSDSHLGHVFSDGPAPTGLRYCMNSASLAFIPADELESRGYGEYLGLFKD